MLAYGQPSQEARKIFVTNQFMGHFYILSGILVDKRSLKVSCQFNAKSGVIDQLTLGDRPVDRDRLVGHA